MCYFVEWRVQAFASILHGHSFHGAPYTTGNVRYTYINQSMRRRRMKKKNSGAKCFTHQLARKKQSATTTTTTSEMPAKPTPTPKAIFYSIWFICPFPAAIISVSIDNGVPFILSLSLFLFFFGANSIIFCSHHVHTQHVLFWNRLPFGRNVLQPFL